MAEVTVFHNPKCSTSNKALVIAGELGVPVEVVDYPKRPLDRATLEFIVDHVDGPVADLVRKDALFERLGLDPGDYTTRDAVLDLLVREPMLMQRPLVRKGDRVVIGRPVERVRDLLG